MEKVHGLWGPAWTGRRVVEIVSQSYDDDRSAVGSSPYQGDMAAPGVRVPTDPTTSQTNRYTFILAGIDVPGGCGLVLRNLRQAATLRATTTSGTGDDAVVTVVERPIVTPFWSFPDGNISWHVRFRPNKMSARRVRDPSDGALPGQTPDYVGLDSALVYQGLSPYQALGAGIPPGPGVYGLGTFRDIRYPWNSQVNEALSIPLRGPGTLLFMASVYQTNTETRSAPPACTNLGALTPEDLFWSSYSNAQYGRVAGAMTVELYPGDK